MTMWHMVGRDHAISLRVDPGAPDATAEAPSMHCHHALQLSVALELPLAYRVSAAGPAADAVGRSAWGVLIGPDVLHEVAGAVADFMCEPESTLGRRVLSVLRHHGSAHIELTRGQVAPLAALAHARDAADLDALHRAALRSVVALGDDVAPLPPLDPRIVRILPHVLDENGRTRPLSNLARRAGLSPERFRRVFSTEIGLPLRKYALWKRTLEAARAITLNTGNARLSTIAYDVGFADQAALSRSYRQQFGRLPSSFAREPSRHAVEDHEDGDTA